MRRFVTARHDTDWLVLDLKNPDSPIVVCTCSGFKAPLQAEYLTSALEHYHAHLLDKFGIKSE